MKFLLSQVGLEAAEAKARENIKIYRSAALSLKLKHGQHANYRREFIEAALSFRFLLRIGFLRQIVADGPVAS